ncbi:MAG: hypothetical protein J6S94_04925 [Bacteroidaceae bacterium]|nr:hypothetical protein [Bacteroidaceae bacterium]
MRLKLFILLLLGYLVTWAQSPKALLDEVVQKTFAEGCVAIDFSAYMDGSNTQGHITVQGKQFVLETPGMKTWFDGKKQWTLVEENEEVNVSEPTEEELQLLNPYAWMSLYQQGYELKYGETGVPDVRKVIMTTTIPREEMQSIVLLIHQTKLYPVRLSMASRGGLDVVVIDINRYEVKQHPLPAAAFVFDKSQYPDVEVIDLR